MSYVYFYCNHLYFHSLNYPCIKLSCMKITHSSLTQSSKFRLLKILMRIQMIVCLRPMWRKSPIQLQVPQNKMSTKEAFNGRPAKNQQVRKKILKTRIFEISCDIAEKLRIFFMNVRKTAFTHQMCKIGSIPISKMRLFYLLTGVRNYIKDMIMKIIEVHAEVFAVSPVFVTRVTQKVIEAVSEELTRLIQCVTEHGPYSPIQVKIVNSSQPKTQSINSVAFCAVCVYFLEICTIS